MEVKKPISSSVPIQWKLNVDPHVLDGHEDSQSFYGWYNSNINDINAIEIGRSIVQLWTSPLKWFGVPLDDDISGGTTPLWPPSVCSSGTSSKKSIKPRVKAVLGSLLEGCQQDSFRYLKNLQIEEHNDVCHMTFHFRKNPYFENTFLTKKIDFKNKDVSSNSDAIIWKANANFDLPNELKSPLKDAESFYEWYIGKNTLNATFIAQNILDLWINPLEWFEIHLDYEEDSASDEAEESTDSADSITEITSQLQNYDVNDNIEKSADIPDKGCLSKDVTNITQ
ncbi:hypothetical protein RN001_016124 [Aquatica leii]|uniref:Uncharacterized protein n=1 Tax=Aquatica leii TaxID=1421715 RepID=A0AAN7PY31_9COLE|nr:hypothetical protein RN001_016124 [Aquatica leii]